VADPGRSITAELGCHYQGLDYSESAAAELIDAHQQWSDWLGDGRVRKFAVVAEKR
jgi:hypothetical protein